MNAAGSFMKGYANSWNMESCEMLDTLNEVKQFVDLSVTADSDLIRYQATNQILLKMWKYFRNLLEELKQECQEPEENEEERPQEEEPPEAEMICPLSSRQVKYLKVSDKNTYISFWSVGIFMHTISLYIF